MRSWKLHEIASDAELLVSELVTNALLHARSAAEVVMHRNHASVRISVRDGSVAQPRLRSHGVSAVTGHGLVLVDRIADRWGSDKHADGKCVWFEFDVDGEGVATPNGDARAES